MSEATPITEDLSTSDQHRRMWRGEITPEEYVEFVRDNVYTRLGINREEVERFRAERAVHQVGRGAAGSLRAQ